MYKYRNSHKHQALLNDLSTKSIGCLPGSSKQMFWLIRWYKTIKESCLIGQYVKKIQTN